MRCWCTERDGLYIDDLGSLNGTYVNRRRIESHRLQNGDELQIGKYKLTCAWTSDEWAGRRERSRAQGQGAHDRSGLQAASSASSPTSISRSATWRIKLRSARRTPGGYRLYGQADVDRLRTILRLQRDEFLPLRVIRQELAAGRARRAGRRPKPAAPDPRSVRRSTSPFAGPARCTGSTTVSRTPGRTALS